MVLAPRATLQSTPDEVPPAAVPCGEIPPSSQFRARFRPPANPGTTWRGVRSAADSRRARARAVRSRRARRRRPPPAPATAALSSSKAGAKHVALTRRASDRAAMRPPDGQPHAGASRCPRRCKSPATIPAAAVTVGGRAAGRVAVAGRAVTIALPLPRGDDVRLDPDGASRRSSSCPPPGSAIPQRRAPTPCASRTAARRSPRRSKIHA